ncbi:hypothetical protein J1N35_000072 [Gossypium stocksii]|uniref:Uncharacterized protein n=1 Tax=Gossypium stocksii TaxID=47602 RepID=A0A9D3WG69_9ROSI|nr:hypothetical protein J1N35_000072 [Gossypium stocksii]
MELIDELSWDCLCAGGLGIYLLLRWTSAVFEGGFNWSFDWLGHSYAPKKKKVSLLRTSAVFEGGLQLVPFRC